MKRLIVITMERACTVVDWLAGWPLLGWIARLGCPRGLGLWSALLDERWRTGVWEDSR